MTTQAWECAAVAPPRAHLSAPRWDVPQVCQANRVELPSSHCAFPFGALRQAAYREAVKIVAILIIINRFL